MTRLISAVVILLLISHVSADEWEDKRQAAFLAGASGQLSVQDMQMVLDYQKRVESGQSFVNAGAAFDKLSTDQKMSLLKKVANIAEVANKKVDAEYYAANPAASTKEPSFGGYVSSEDE